MRRILILLLLGGCSISNQSLRAVALPSTTTVPPEQATDKSFLLYPLEDERGGEVTRIDGTTFFPIINFFHMGQTQRYPDSGGALFDNSDRRTLVTGGLDNAMPFMLGRLMREMGFAARVTPVENVDSKMDLSKFDYVVRGKIKRTNMRTQANLIPLAILSVLGAPWIFVNYEIDYELILIRNSDGQIVTRNSYSWKGREVIGLYYHWGAFQKLFVEGLAQTLPKAVQDLAAAVRPMRPEVTWKTHRAEHKVQLTVDKSDGSQEKRSLRGAIAVERPGKLRLRALGPAGITLFDLLVVEGNVKVLQAIKDPNESLLGPIIQSLANDLRAMYQLEPAVERPLKLSRFSTVNGKSIPTRVEIENRELHYRVDIEVIDPEIDVTLDPELFKE